jgi:predicted secreted Zn-dependent protease
MYVPIRFSAAVLVCLSISAASAAEWKATEIVKPYTVAGTTGIELYESIGQRGPKSGERRTIAHTTFDLKWRRNYVPQSDGSCLLVSAIPFLTITYTWPKTPSGLSEPTRSRWNTFIEGIQKHERVHGDIIKQLVDRILATTVGTTVANDPNCKKIREQIQAPLKAASDAHLAASRDFDKVEMGDGGNVHRLILGLVNP